MAAATRNTAIPAPKVTKRTLPVNTITPIIPAIRAKTPIAATIHPNASLIIMLIYYTHKVIIPYYCTEFPHKQRFGFENIIHLQIIEEICYHVEL